MSEIILIGHGGHAKACIDVIEQENRFRIAGLVGKRDNIGKVVYGYSIIGSDKDLGQLFEKFKIAFVTVGQTRFSDSRYRIYENLKSIGFFLPVIVSPHSYVSKSARLGSGTIVMHRTVINADAEIGVNCIINNNALIEHDVKIGDNCHISTGAIINGHSVVGAGSLIGSGAVLNQCVEVTRNCIVGSNSLVVKSIRVPDIYVGNPAKRIVNE